MTLAPGTRLGSYEIDAMLGAGGMGEVYRARDIRLGRYVAIKVLPGELASDPQRRQRFEREARVVASLSHPHICALHDIGIATPPGAAGAVDYLVMEYLEGETLAERMSRGAIPQEEVVSIGSAIAVALEAAHRRLIVHRDLKPSNIMLTGSGVKLLDFGLAKAFAPETDATSMLTTVSADVSSPGMLLGTVPYMAPEQIQGRDPDARSDIFALGAVLYEMATGRRAFPGGTAAAIAGAILSAEPPPIAASPSLDRLVRGCLRKNPDDRWHSARDVALQLGDVQERDAAIVPARSARLPWMLAAAFAFFAVAALGYAWRAGGGVAGHVSPTLRFELPPQPGGGYMTVDVERVPFAMSPDGTRVAYTGGIGAGPPSVWIRSLASETPTRLAGTEGATSVFWSPDGDSLGFFAGSRLKRVDVTGGTPIELCPVAPYLGHTGTWGGDQILFSSVQGERLYRVSELGGAPVEVLRPDPAIGERRIVWPSFLPDGRHFLYLSSRDQPNGAVMLASLDGQRREVLRVRSNAQFVEPGFVVYGSEGVLLARRFDQRSGEVSGQPIALADAVTYALPTGLTQFSAARTGAVIFHSGLDTARVISADSIGRSRAEIRPASPIQHFRLSRDGRTLLVDRREPKTSVVNIWRYVLDRGVESRVTSEAAAAVNGVIADDGALIFSALRGGSPVLLRQPLSGPEQPLAPGRPGMQVEADLSPDGRWVIYSQRGSQGIHLNVVSLDTRQVTPYHHSDRSESQPRFSPDGRYVAFASDASGRVEIYVAPFPAPGASQIVSATGGLTPRWSADGRVLYFSSTDGTVYRTPVSTSPSLQIGRPEALFSKGSRGRWIRFEPVTGGFIALEPVSYAAEQPLHIVLNWR